LHLAMLAKEYISDPGRAYALPIFVDSVHSHDACGLDVLKPGVFRRLMRGHVIRKQCHCTLLIHFLVSVDSDGPTLTHPSRSFPGPVENAFHRIVHQPPSIADLTVTSVKSFVPLFCHLLVSGSVFVTDYRCVPRGILVQVRTNDSVAAGRTFLSTFS
jgi:hypothetical protein